MAEEEKPITQAEEVKNEQEQVVETQNEEKKTFTMEEVKNLLNAKNYEKEGRKTAEAEVKSLKAELAKLKGEDSVSKFKEDEFENMKKQLADLQNEKEELIKKAEENDLKDQLRLFKGILPEALDDVLNKAKEAGFSKTEVGYLDKDGKTLQSFYENLKSTRGYYFGLSQNHNLVNQQFRDKVDNDAKSRNTLNIIQGALRNTNFKDLAMQK